MGFFLLGRHRDDATLALVDARLFETRQDAIDALAEIDVSGDLESEVFAVDLDLATPLVVVHQKSAETPQPAGDASPADEPSGADEQETDLAGALGRATGAMEDEGVVPPESIGPADPPDSEDGAWPWDAATPPDDIAAAVADSAPEPPVEPELAAPEPTEAEVPEPEVQEAAVEEPAEFVPDPFEEPAVAVSDLVTGVSDEDADISKPVIMGAYAEASAAQDEPTPAAELEVPPEAEPLPGTDPALESVLADLEIPESPPEEDQTPPPASLDAPAPDAPPDVPPGVTEGTSDLSDLTCDDCVYLNTCPKRGESDPSSCGSFQWRST